MDSLYEALRRAAGSSQVKQDESMAKHTTFRVGGPARFFVSPSDESALRDVVELCQKKKVPYYILGNGSNLLVSDKGYGGVIISMMEGFSWVKVEALDASDGAVLTAGAGILLSRLAKTALENSLTGFEFAAGIPGTLGGAVVMNAGAYGGEMRQVILKASVLTGDGSIKDIPAEELQLGYRHSCIPEKNYIVLSAQIALKEGNRKTIQDEMEQLASKRREKQPLEYPSAGSAFKRPAGHFAGQLIEQAGLKGYQVGGAQVSEKHCGFVINKDHATAADILNLCKDVKKQVRDKSGVDLETEIKMLGWD